MISSEDVYLEIGKISFVLEVFEFLSVNQWTRIYGIE